MAIKTKDVMINILAAIGFGVISAADLLFAVAAAPYGSSMGQVRRAMADASDDLWKCFSEDEERAKKKRYYNLVYKLKKEGLLEEVEKGGKKFFQLTKKGREKLAKRKEEPVLPPTRYAKEKDERFVIVMFDIPEVERRKRAWIRAVLINLGFSMAQKSVWMGKVRIPQAFIDDLMKMGLEDFVEIFQVTKTGNLKHVI